MKNCKFMKSEGGRKRDPTSSNRAREESMVAISLYRGNLHRVPDVPRRWLMPTHNISIKDFKSLLQRRSKALSRLRATTSSSPAKLSTSPNPNPNLNSSIKPDADGPGNNGSAPEVPFETQRVSVGGERPSAFVKERKKSDIGDNCMGKSADGFDSLNAPRPCFVEQGSNPVENGGAHVKDENLAVFENPSKEVIKEEDLLDDKENRKREVEEKLKVLNEKKHNLVQVLKQILHVEEELKRRSSVQGMAIRPSAPLQVDASADTGSMTKLLASRVGSEVNASGDAEGGEADDLLNQNVLARQMLRNSSMSPSSESPLRRPAHIQPNMGSHPSRANFSVTGSPSCLPPAGQSGIPPNLPTVSVSGTNYIASSPSPAASGGTSVLRDARQPSPWN
ncbi:stress response protein NST1 [Benincasa hispida]|uniref:stress response protein NST1 n=1 Tax=Benincasa hispida TaxID=102211 RepID=UPI0018FFF097|nr:stress response protein NST1 [Benincasa hispida]